MGIEMGKNILSRISETYVQQMVNVQTAETVVIALL
jgi:hypothetical protein